MELGMLESVPSKSKRPKRECRARKRPSDAEIINSKYVKYDETVEIEESSNVQFALASESEDEQETESKCSTSDEPDVLAQVNPLRQVDENSDLEEIDDDTLSSTTTMNPFPKTSSDQHRFIPVVIEQDQPSSMNFSRHSKRLIGQFKYLYNHGIRKAVQPTLCPDGNVTENSSEKIRFELRNTFNRLDLFQEGYCVLSNEAFPFVSLCYLCGSTGGELIYCSNCCQAYHPTCLNDLERPRFEPVIDSWLCPNCHLCSICGLLREPQTISSRLNRSSSDASAHQLISCSDCQRRFHWKCFKRSTEDLRLQSNSTTETNSIVSFSRLTHSYLLNQIWSCPSCVKCDCGEELLSPSSLMCTDCSTNLKFLRLHKNDQIDRCHFCEKFIEQIFIKNQSSLLMQCSRCQHRFHPKCDGYLPEDPLLLLSTPLICSKCDRQRRDELQHDFIQMKRRLIRTILEQLFIIVQQISSDRHDISTLKNSFERLAICHQSRWKNINLSAFLNDLLRLIDRHFSSTDLSRWQSVIHGSILRQCPWFKPPTSLNNSPSISPRLNEHSYALTKFSFRPQIQRKKNLFCITSDSLLRYLDETSLEEEFRENFPHDDWRKCQLCLTISDHSSATIGRLISYGLNQWVHVGCILAAYAKNLDQPPYILRNIRETVLRCQTKYLCSLCSKLGASVHCYENECYQRYHCHCIEKYYSTWDKTHLQSLNIDKGFLPNLTTLCLRHNGMKRAHRDSAETINDENLNQNGLHPLPKIKLVKTSSPVYGDLSNAIVEFPLDTIQLAMGSLQVEHLGDFDYFLDHRDPILIIRETYPNNYRASRLFWSLNNPRKKTVYRLHIQIVRVEDHRTISPPQTDEEFQLEEIYRKAREYFEKLQKQIDEHFTAIEEFCQKTMVNKKSKETSSTTTKKKLNHTGSVGTTKRLSKATPSCVKRQTPKAALKNVSRPRNRFAHEKQTMNKTAAAPPTTTTATSATPIPDLNTLFNKACLKNANLSEIALVIAQAITQAAQVAPPMNKTTPTPPTPSVDSSNGPKVEKDTDVILKQLLKNISTTTPQTHEIPPVANHVSQWRTTIASVSNSKSADDIRVNGHSTPLDSPLICNGSFTPVSDPSTTENPSNILTMKMSIPQVDGCVDLVDEVEDDLQSMMNEILSQIQSESTPMEKKEMIDVSTDVPWPFPVDPSPPLDELIRTYQQWSKTIHGRVQFTITNDEGFHLASDDLDAAWTSIVEQVRTARDDMNLTHFPMNNDELNGHKVFGLTSPIVHTMLNQLYTQTSNSKSSSTPSNAVILPLSSSLSLTNIYDNFIYTLENLQKKHGDSSSSRTSFHERKHRERQRFGWLLNQSRKIDYALKSFEIDETLLHARRILLEEASVSLRLYHLHYFSDRALLVGSSPIHGCGLFTLIDLVEGQMIIEYTGEVVRPCLTDKRERENEGKGFGCYMFTVDSMHVIDATHRGNKARFINHNCTPNCFAKTVLSGGVKHIVIYALTDIPRGSELTYDYSFPEEDVKIPCHCGTSQCRIYLN